VALTAILLHCGALLLIVVTINALPAQSHSFPPRYEGNTGPLSWTTFTGPGSGKKSFGAMKVCSILVNNEKPW
jgi:hypothetical protein